MHKKLSKISKTPEEVQIEQKINMCKIQFLFYLPTRGIELKRNITYKCLPNKFTSIFSACFVDRIRSNKLGSYSNPILKTKGQRFRATVS